MPGARGSASEGAPQKRERAWGCAEGFPAEAAAAGHGSSPTPRPRNSGTGSEVNPLTTHWPSDVSGQSTTLFCRRHGSVPATRASRTGPAAPEGRQAVLSRRRSAVYPHAWCRRKPAAVATAETASAIPAGGSHPRAPAAEDSPAACLPGWLWELIASSVYSSQQFEMARKFHVNNSSKELQSGHANTGPADPSHRQRARGPRGSGQDLRGQRRRRALVIREQRRALGARGSGLPRRHGHWQSHSRGSLLLPEVLGGSAGKAVRTDVKTHLHLGGLAGKHRTRPIHHPGPPTAHFSLPARSRRPIHGCSWFSSLQS